MNQQIRPEKEHGSSQRSSPKKKKYRTIAHHTLGGLQLVVLAKSEICDIEICSINDVALGLGNVMLNKGAICLILKIGSMTIALVTAHLAAHHGAVQERNTQYIRTDDELLSTLPDGRTFHHVVDATIFFGDLNYRLHGLRRSEVELALSESAESELLYFDQLFRERGNGHAFSPFSEPKLTFLPTYKFDRHSNSYDSSSKRRIPAWTDRILYTPHSRLHLIEYSSIPSAKHSDHRPILARFQLLSEQENGDNHHGEASFLPSLTMGREAVHTRSSRLGHSPRASSTNVKVGKRKRYPKTKEL
mmetsp:Transcript_16679/g.25060  ORF Transcript_16679/g.25060 Transcript_16679/m.25060 type:complete len:303 (+) Transcript_16679:190-1098(+)